MAKSLVLGRRARVGLDGSWARDVYSLPLSYPRDSDTCYLVTTLLHGPPSAACSSILTRNLETDAFLNPNRVYLPDVAFSSPPTFQDWQVFPRLLGSPLSLSLELTTNAILFLLFSSSLGSSHLPRLRHPETPSPPHFPLLHHLLPGSWKKESFNSPPGDTSSISWHRLVVALRLKILVPWHLKGDISHTTCHHVTLIRHSSHQVDWFIKVVEVDEESIGPSKVLIVAGWRGSRLGRFLSDNRSRVTLHRPLLPVMSHPKFTGPYEELSNSHCLRAMRWWVNATFNTQFHHHTRTDIIMGRRWS